MEVLFVAEMYHHKSVVLVIDTLETPKLGLVIKLLDGCNPIDIFSDRGTMLKEGNEFASDSATILDSTRRHRIIHKNLKIAIILKRSNRILAVANLGRNCKVASSRRAGRQC